MSLPPFEHVVARYGPVVLRVCRAVVGSADADDAWSETFLAALRAYPELREGSDVQAWLVTIAHRKGLDQQRARSRRAIPVADVPESATRDPESDAELWVALAALPVTQRHAVAYHHLAGLPYREVAGILGNSEAAARRAAADGIAALRRRYPHGPRSTPPAAPGPQPRGEPE